MRFATAIASLTCLGLAVAQSNSTNVVRIVDRTLAFRQYSFWRTR